MNHIFIALAVSLAFAIIKAFVSYQDLNAPKNTTRSLALCEPQVTQCSICLEECKEFENIISLPCRHKLHRDCASKLFSGQSHNSCPYCRDKISIQFLKENYLM